MVQEVVNPPNLDEEMDILSGWGMDEVQVYNILTSNATI
jgi:hypothetical protein